MLEQLLVYHASKRPLAGVVLKTSEFLRFHLDHQAEEARRNEDQSLAVNMVDAPATSAIKRTMSYVLQGSVERHNTALGFRKFEHALTTILATMLAKSELVQLLTILKERGTNSHQQGGDTVPTTIGNDEDDYNFYEDDDDEKQTDPPADPPAEQPGQFQLYVATVQDLQRILDKDLKQDPV
jgi:hypothetical protein